MEILFDRPSKDTLTVGGGKVHGGETFEVDDETGAALLATPVYHCRVPGPEPEPEPAPAPRGRRRIPDDVVAPDPIVATVDEPEPVEVTEPEVEAAPEAPTD